MENNNITVALGCDHGGFPLKERLKAHLLQRGIPCQDFGCHSTDSCDYPIFGERAARAVASGQCRFGVVVCTTGIGISITANKVRGIRCALCHEPWSAKMTRRHNDANMLALGAEVTGPSLAVEILDAFLDTSFEGGRHQRRVDLIADVEARE